jgi:hypothetical protein
MEHASKTATFLTVQRSYGEQVVRKEYVEEQVLPRHAAQ